MIDLRACSLANPTPLGCQWCGASLPKRRSRWCSELCVKHFERNHLWQSARAAAMRRDRKRCVRCNSTKDLEVNHIVPISMFPEYVDGKRPTTSCGHHLSNLEVLCRVHHQAATREQRASGLLPKPFEKRLA